MKTLGVLVATILFSATPSFAAGQRAVDPSDHRLFSDVSKAVTSYAHFTIFDDVNAEVHDGVVTVTGKVTMPYKKSGIAGRIARVQGVREVRDRITVLPVSRFDDQLRARIARAIYGNSNFRSYAVLANPPIHIVVDRGRVTLTGVVQSEVDRAIARSLAADFAAPVDSELKTNAELRDALERLS
jgi:hyperosmotically inducible periplasmic protein